VSGHGPTRFCLCEYPERDVIKRTGVFTHQQFCLRQS
jgi:hypothetical protein